MKFVLWSLLIVTLAVYFHSVMAAPPGPTYAFVNGQWWDGSEYVSRPMYVVDGELRDVRPPRLDETVDLHHQFVIPPLAEGHNHWLEADQIDAYNACYLADGVFYVKDMANVPYVIDRIRDKVNLSTSVDFVTALQGFTGPGSHPIEILDYFVKAGIFPSTWKSPYDPEAEFVVQTQRDVDERFKILLAENPDYVKVFLLFYDEIAIPNLKLIRDSGVPILLGSDHFRFSPLSELFVMRDTGRI